MWLGGRIGRRGHRRLLLGEMGRKALEYPICYCIARRFGGDTMAS
jgi:hypothetical protein